MSFAAAPDPSRRSAGSARLVLAGSFGVVVLAAALGAFAAPVIGREPFMGALAGVGLAAVAFLLSTVELSLVFSLALALSIFSGYSGYLGFPIGPDRLLFAFGCARLVLAGFPRRHPGYGAPHWLVLFAATFAALSTAWSYAQQDHQSVFELLDRFGLVPFLLFFIAPVVFATERDRRILLATLSIVGLYLGLTAIFEMVGPSSLVFPRYILDPSVGLHFGRARGPFAEGGSNGLAMHACAVAAILLAARVRRPGVRLALGAVVALCAIGILLTLTRQVWVGAFASLVVLLFAGPRLRRLALALVVAVGITVGLAYVAVPGIKAKIESRATDQRPVWDRLNLNAAAVRMVEQRPLLGWGWNGFRTDGQDWIRQAQTYPETAPQTSVHNVLLANLAELGTLGTALWVAALLAAVGVAALRRPPPGLDDWRLGLAAVAIAWVVVVNLSPMNKAFPNALLWLWAGVVWRPRALAVAAAEPGAPPAPPRPGAPAPVTPGLVPVLAGTRQE